MSKLMIFFVGIVIGMLLIALITKFKHILDEIELEEALEDVLEEEDIEIL